MDNYDGYKAEFMIAQKDLKGLLDYNPDTGLFRWIKSGGGRKASRVAGGLSGGYMLIMIEGKNYLAHRLAWMIIHGEWPKDQIDHINHDRADNRIINLREATSRENLRNASLYKTNTSGVCGVCWYKRCDKWIASIKINGKTVHLGYSADKFEAICARKSAENKYGFHENHGL